MRLCALILVAFLGCVANARAQTAASTGPSPDLRMVVVVTRHGIRSPTDPNELEPYVAYPMASWEVPPGYLTPRGATMMTNFGAAYRSFYADANFLPAAGCPSPDAIYVWADVDQRTKATAAALLDGLVPHCGFVAHDIGSTVDPLFHALPSVGKADPVTSAASVEGWIGDDPGALVQTHALAFTRLDAILGCGNGKCTKVSTLATRLAPAPKSGLVKLTGAVDLASTAVEDFILAYADGKQLRDIGNGAVDRETLLALSQLHALKSLVETDAPYVARVQGSNLLEHLLATIDQGGSGNRNSKTRVPLGARFVAFVGHDTNLDELAGMLQLRWLVPGYQLNDTPPGGALVFEIHQRAADAAPFVRAFFEAQSLDQMRNVSSDAPARVPVFVPGCPNLDCPLPTFDRVAKAAIDPAFVAAW